MVVGGVGRRETEIQKVSSPRERTIPTNLLNCLLFRLVADGQIEIVSGGWVMPDEANSHYYSLIQQLTQGHQWLHKYLDYKPK